MADDIRFDWDEANIAHIARHKVTPEEVAQVFANGPADREYRHVKGEDRYTILGHTDNLRVLLVVWTDRNGMVRPVTAREAGKRVRGDYFREAGEKWKD